MAVAIVASAGPVGISSGFEDDDGNLAVNSTFDWNGFAPLTWTGDAPYREATKVVSGWSFLGLEDDEEDTSDTAFAGGTKQDDDCAKVIGAKAPNKDDLKRAYLSTKSVAFPNDATNPTHIILNLAWVRIPQNTTSASAHVGFEFNKAANGACSGPGGLVKRTAGDMLIVYDFSGGSTTPILTLRRWVTSGSCEVGSNSPPCWGTATNLTAGGFAEGAVNVGSTASDALAPDAPPEILGDSEFGEAGVDLTKAGIFTGSTCESFGNVFAVSRSSGNSAQAQMKDLVGPGDFTIGNCGKVIIRKQTVPDGDTSTEFTYDTVNVATLPATTVTPFKLKDDGVNTINNVVAGSAKSVTEQNPGPLYKLTSIDCTASTVPAANISTDTTTRAVTFSLGVNETLDCTFTNEKQLGALKILKKSTKTNALVKTAGAVFSYDSSSVTDNGTGDEDLTIGEICVSGLAVGNYSVNETTPPPGYGSGATTPAQTATVVAGSNCTDSEPTGAAVVTFTNPPLADIQVRFRDAGSGETALDNTAGPDTGMTCDNATGTSSRTDTANWDDTLTIDDIQAGAAVVTVTCKILIDP